MKAIVIDEPWISLILSGAKTWEMRKGSCSHRGPVALIRKGSGQVVGTANIVDSLPPLTTAEAYSAGEPNHRIPVPRQHQAREDGWTTPWVLADAHELSPVVNYKHPYGAVIWVNLEPDVAAAISAQAGAAAPTAPVPILATPAAVRPAQPVSDGVSIPAQPTALGDQRVVTITGGNLRNNHIYLPLEFFPADAIGGKNRDEAAPRQVTVTFTPGQVVQADIDSPKRILRSRAPIGDFFARAGVTEGDKVVITKRTPYAYSVSKA